MLIGVCSDSHDNVPNIKKTVSFFSSQNISKVIHAGDYCSPFTIQHFNGLNLHGILGNNDGDIYLLMKKFGEINAHLHGEFYRFETDSRTIAVYHGTVPEITQSLIKSGTYDAVFSGHTHEASVLKTDGTLAINPGTIHGFGEPGTVAVYDSVRHEASIYNLKK
jgi:putative phosphoesterase